MQLFVRDLRRERCNLFIGTQSAERMIRAPTMAAIVLEKSIAETYCRVAVGCGSSRTASVIFYARPVRDRCYRFVARPNACTPSLGQLWGGSRSPRCSDDLSFSIRRSTKAPTPHPQLLRAAELDFKAIKMSVPYTQKKHACGPATNHNLLKPIYRLTRRLIQSDCRPVWRCCTNLSRAPKSKRPYIDGNEHFAALGGALFKKEATSSRIAFGSG